MQSCAHVAYSQFTRNKTKLLRKGAFNIGVAPISIFFGVMCLGTFYSFIYIEVVRDINKNSKVYFLRECKISHPLEEGDWDVNNIVTESDWGKSEHRNLDDQSIVTVGAPSYKNSFIWR